jgi:hypothetical protein
MEEKSLVKSERVKDDSSVNIKDDSKIGIILFTNRNESAYQKLINQ